MLRPDEEHADAIFQVAADTGRFLVDDQFLISPLDTEHSPALIAKAAWHGYLPMFTKRENLVLLKMHTARTTLAPGSIHIGRQSRKKAGQFRITVDEAFDEVVKLVNQHTFTSTPGDCWLTQQFADLYKAANMLPEDIRRGVRFHSVELWHNESGELVAGDIGYTVGSIYSSATGFALKDKFPGCGTLMLCALGMLLQRGGFELWDLGMEMDYKKDLGAEVHPRTSWLACVHKLRQNSARLEGQAATATTKELLVVSKEQLAKENTELADTGQSLLSAALATAS